MMTVMMSSQLSIRGSIVFLLVLPLVSSQCSTCLDGKCHDDGECITGCVPGYVDRYCDDKCPANCINSVCHISHSGTVTCSDGCKPGYCGAKCSVPCPPGCETCGRSCDNCDMTLCPQGQYGENCESTCDLKFEKCDSESGNCVKCRPGYYGDECGKTCPSSCLSSDKVLLSRCVSQCQSCSSEDFCQPGVYGMSCDMNCSGNCGRPDSSEQRPCNKATGECSAGCQSGYYGRNCNYTCSELCLPDTCYQHNGTCEYGCLAGFTISNGICAKNSDRVPQAIVITGVICGLLILIINVIIVIICCMRRKRKRSMTPGYQEEMVHLNVSSWLVLFSWRSGEAYVPLVSTFSNIQANFAEARSYCEHLGSHLAIITSLAEDNFVRGFAIRRKVDHFLGASDLGSEGIWRWEGGQPLTYKNW